MYKKIKLQGNNLEVTKVSGYSSLISRFIKNT